MTRPKRKHDPRVCPEHPKVSNCYAKSTFTVQPGDGRIRTNISGDIGMKVKGTCSRTACPNDGVGLVHRHNIKGDSSDRYRNYCRACQKLINHVNNQQLIMTEEEAKAYELNLYQGNYE